MKKFIVSAVLIVFIFSNVPLIRAQAAVPAQNNEALIALLKQLIELLVKQLATLQAELAARLASQTQSSILPQTAFSSGVNPKAIVHLLCVYKPKPGKEDFTGNQEKTLRGTGAIVHSEGYILTVRHIVDPAWSLAAYPTDKNASFYAYLKENYNLSHCDVSEPSTSKFITLSAAKSSGINSPALLATYSAALHTVPQKINVSDKEYNGLDFAILKIEKPINCVPQKPCTSPSAFPYVRSDPDPAIPSVNEVVNLGYPITLNPGDNILKALVGKITEYYGGDQYFKGKALNILWSAENLLKPGSSGSPIIYGDRIVGIELGGSREEATTNYGLAIQAIYQNLKDAGREYVFAVQ